MLLACPSGGLQCGAKGCTIWDDGPSSPARMPPWSLAALLERPLVTGVGFELSWLETIHPQPHDIRMGLIGHRAPVRLYRCKAMGRLVDLIIPEPQRARHWAGFRKVMDTGG